MAHYEEPTNSADGLGVSLYGDYKEPDNDEARAPAAEKLPPLPSMFITGNKKSEVCVYGVDKSIHSFYVSSLHMLY
jgi:hypothetical protein